MITKHHINDVIYKYPVCDDSKGTLEYIKGNEQNKLRK